MSAGMADDTGRYKRGWMDGYEKGQKDAAAFFLKEIAEIKEHLTEVQETIESMREKEGTAASDDARLLNKMDKRP